VRYATNKILERLRPNTLRCGWLRLMRLARLAVGFGAVSYRVDDESVMGFFGEADAVVSDAGAEFFGVSLERLDVGVCSAATQTPASASITPMTVYRAVATSAAAVVV